MLRRTRGGSRLRSRFQNRLSSRADFASRKEFLTMWFSSDQDEFKTRLSPYGCRRLFDLLSRASKWMRRPFQSYATYACTDTSRLPLPQPLPAPRGESGISRASDACAVTGASLARALTWYVGSWCLKVWSITLGVLRLAGGAEKSATLLRCTK